MTRVTTVRLTQDMMTGESGLAAILAALGYRKTALSASWGVIVVLCIASVFLDFDGKYTHGS